MPTTAVVAYERLRRQFQTHIDNDTEDSPEGEELQCDMERLWDLLDRSERADMNKMAMQLKQKKGGEV